MLLLLALVLTTLVWLAGRFEASQVQDTLERDTAAAADDVRLGLGRNVQSLQALQFNDPSPGSWRVDAAEFVRLHRELLRVQWRRPDLTVLAQAESPFRPHAFEWLGSKNTEPDVTLACTLAKRANGPSYSGSYFLPQMDGLGLEVMEMCMPLITRGQLTGYLVATYALGDVLADMVGRQLSRSQEVSFIEPDGTRLVLHGSARRGTRVFTARQLVNLPGNTMVLRMDSWHGDPDVYPNLMTALVTLMSIALVSVTALLVKDTRRRLSAERSLADALAFRKAMEDSLLTGLRARDLQGRITYVNPAFCQMVGFAADELWGRGMPAPFWPPDLASEYQQRQEIRMAGSAPPREGFSSVFMRKDGSVFPVLVMEAPLINAQGVHTGWMSAVVDVTEQRRAEELSRTSQDRLQATARLATVGEMASLLSHELNQPLAAISSYATGSLNRLQTGGALVDTADLATAMRRIAEQVERAGKLIRSVHDFVRRRAKVREPVAPQVLLDAILPLVQLQARKLGVQVQLDVAEVLPPVLCDRSMVEQVLLNLTRNAMQAMEHPAVAERLLVLRVVQLPPPLDGWVEFSVSDRGPGIPPEVAERLFTPFFTTKDEGMGLGLSLCRTVVEQHGGSLTFMANGPQGTVFRFTLPIPE
ncbi:adaptive-response sensory-kinase SasA [Comamonadaceae bacterium OS-1]|nr:adaptive-response sensory-kinase SasA [Comamonadaceae bacterium OS-1]